MLIHVPTFFLLMACVTAFGSVAMLVEARRSKAKPLLVWGIAYAVITGGSLATNLRLVGWDFVGIGLSNILTLAAYGLLWKGACTLSGRPCRFLWTAGALAWAFVYLLTPLSQSLEARVLLGSFGVVVYSTLAGRELHRLGERLPTARITAFAFFAHAAFYTLRMAVVATPGALIDAKMMTGFSFTAVVFEGVIAAVIFAHLLVSIMREDAANGLAADAQTDFLTGIANRRAFTCGARRLLQEAPTGGASGEMALLLFDLDHFKQLNDRYGHAFGDEVLKVFARTARDRLGGDQGLARLGGEEFAVLLPHSDLRGAEYLAQVVSSAFTASVAQLREPPVVATTSVGLAMSGSPPQDLETLMAAADAALYRAKRRGRNRVETATPFQTQSAGALPSALPA